VHRELRDQPEQRLHVDARRRHEAIDETHAVKRAFEVGAGDCSIFRIKEKPLEWGPEDGNPRTTSPARVADPSMMASFSTTPTQNPARS